MVSVPIPIVKYEKITCYMIQYDMNSEKYNNYRMDVKGIKDTDRISDFREHIERTYGFKKDSFLIVWVCDMKVVNIFHNK